MLGRRNLTKKDLAVLTGLTEMWVGRRLNGQTRISLEDLALIAGALDLAASDLLDVA